MHTDIDTAADFLASSSIIDHDHPAVAALARSLAGASAEQTARNCFDWVRDNIEHSIDHGRDEVTCVASEVLAAGTGLCTAKSHLLVALLRQHGIAAGFCYQRLLFDEAGGAYCSHGLVAVWLDGHGWYRCDARGNKPGIACAFTPGRENLAFAVQAPGECLYDEVWAEPWAELVARTRALRSIADYRAAPLDVAPPVAAANRRIAA
ncbi:transglutaminase family protein [Rugamonas sp. CCM 8940]|nr:transglutaminase family protein [Rugamonas sp. CCM 8940]